MVTATLADLASTTITFNNFKEITRRSTAEDFTPFSFPYDDTEGRQSEVIFIGSWFRVFIPIFILKDDANWPASGKSAADKRADLENLLFNGGDNEWQYTLTFDSEDSTPGSPQTEIIAGKVKNLAIRSISGDNTSHIEGSFEFWEEA